MCLLTMGDEIGSLVENLPAGFAAVHLEVVSSVITVIISHTTTIQHS